MSLALEESFNSPVDGIDLEFIKQDQKFYSGKIPKKGGPYSKMEREKRREEVYRLHFEYGYSAKKISELMNVNRNTINGDVDYWYSKIDKNTNIFNPESVIIVNLERLNIQRSRLREQLDKVDSFQEKMSLERLIYDIDCKILYIHNRVAESSKRILDFSTENLNKWMKDNKREERYMKLYDKISVSEKALEKINKIIKEDRMPRSN
jgi:hypothetical protein